MKRDKHLRKQPKILNIVLVIVFLLNLFFTYKIGLLNPVFTIIVVLLTGMALYFKRKFLKIVLLILYLISSLFTGFATYLMSSLTQKDEVVSSYLITLKDNPVNSIKEIEETEKIGMQPEESLQGYQMYDEYFKDKKYEFSYQEYPSYLDAAIALHEKEVNYIVVDSLKNKELNEYYPTFQDDVKIVDTIERKSKVKTTNKNVKKESVNILLTGGDSRDGSLSGRSDAIMLATINPKTEKAVITSIPRDSYVANTCTGYMDKITHVSNGGINCLISTLEAELSTTIDYYAKINFNFIIDIVDGLGGITVDVDQSFCAPDENDIADAHCFEEGQMNMNGSQALAYSRERKSFADGDYQRQIHQQQVMAGILTEAKSASLTNINAIITSIGGSLSTNMSSTQISNLAQVYQKSENIKFESQFLKGTGDTVDIPALGLYSTSVQIIDETSRTEVSGKINTTLNE